MAEAVDVIAGYINARNSSEILRSAGNQKRSSTFRHSSVPSVQQSVSGTIPPWLSCKRASTMIPSWCVQLSVLCCCIYSVRRHRP